MTKAATFAEVLVALERQYPSYETGLSIRTEIQNLGMLPKNLKAARITELLANLDHWVGRLTPGSYGSDKLLFWLVGKIPTSACDECQATAERKARTLTYEDLSVLLLELALEKESDQHLDAYHPGGGGSGSHGKGYQGPRPGQGTTPKHARIMGNVQELFWCDARDEHGHLQHAPDCDQRDCFVVQGEKQETNTGSKPKMPDHYRCTITCAFCGSASTIRMSATTSNACRRSSRARILVRALARAPARALARTRTTLAKASQKAVGKAQTRAKVDEEEALTASKIRITRTRTSPKATPTLIQGRTPSPLEGSLVPGRPHARRLRPNKSKGPSEDMKVVTMAKLRRERASCGWPVSCGTRGSR